MGDVTCPECGSNATNCCAGKRTTYGPIEARRQLLEYIRNRKYLCGYCAALQKQVAETGLDAIHKYRGMICGGIEDMKIRYGQLEPLCEECKGECHMDCEVVLVQRSTPDPVFEEDGVWWFFDETWAYAAGPYETEEIARAKLDEYLHKLNEGRAEMAHHLDEDDGYHD